MIQEKELMCNVAYQQQKKMEFRKIKCKLEDFTFLKRLGQGGFGEVFLAKNKHFKGFNVALKVIEKAPRSEDREYNIRIVHEILVQFTLKHPFIVNLYTYFRDKEKVYVVLEFVPNGNLFSKIQDSKTLPEQEVAKYIAQTASALKHCHKLGFAHGDIKPENILLDGNNNAKLSDFGGVWPNAIAPKHPGIGTTYYSPPEVIKGGPFRYAGDIWSLGVMAYELIVGVLPFDGPVDKIVKARIISGLFNKTVLSETTEFFISEMLAYDPSDRLSIKQIISHRWITSRYDDISNLPIFSQYEELKLAIRDIQQELFGL